MDRAPTMQDVAEAAGVSRALVSLVMRDSPKVSEQRRSAVLDAAARLGYRPNVLARNLASQRTRTIGVLINDLHNPYFADVVDGLQESAAEQGYRLLLTVGLRRADREHAAVETMLEFRVDGMILLGPRLETARLREAAAAVPVVTVGRTLRIPEVDTVITDEAAGARLAVDHLVELGHRRIVHVVGGKGAGARPRRVGYEKAMSDAGLASEQRCLTGDFTEESGIAAAEQLLASGRLPTAVFAANDLSAMGVIGVLEDAGIDVPGDISVVGYDNTALGATRHSSLTTVDQPREEMGRRAVSALLRRLDDRAADPIRVILPPRLVTRSTTAAVA